MRDKSPRYPSHADEDVFETLVGSDVLTLSTPKIAIILE